MIQKIVFAMLMFTCIALPAQNRKGGHKVLVAYFSHSGNTRTVAQAIGEATGANLFEIIPPITARCSMWPNVKSIPTSART